MPNGWFRKRTQEVPGEMPEGLFTQCKGCREMILTREWERNLKVCPKCGHHHRLTARERIGLLLDEGSFQERDVDLRSYNPLEFPRYSDSLDKYRRETGETDAVVSGEGTLAGYPVTLGVTDAHFMMGSMGSVVGERLTRTVERATELGCATILVSATGGGARMQEGLFSLMQMAKTSGAIARHHDRGLLTVILLTDPSMAGVLASWGSLGDIILAEPGAMIGFVGGRVSKQANVSKVPTNFQTAEFQLEHGQVDRVVPRKELKDTIAAAIAFAGGVRVAPVPSATLTPAG